jgi:hypothetical protein
MNEEYQEELESITKHEIDLEKAEEVKECNLEYNCQCEDCKDARYGLMISRYCE